MNRPLLADERVRPPQHHVLEKILSVLVIIASLTNSIQETTPLMRSCRQLLHQAQHAPSKRLLDVKRVSARLMVDTVVGSVLQNSEGAVRPIRVLILTLVHESQTVFRGMHDQYRFIICPTPFVFILCTPRSPMTI